MKSNGRVILIVGDGSLQMTVQEIGSYVRFGLKPIVFVINNDGYSIERAINGPECDYNDISPHWNYQKMLEFFGAGTGTAIEGRSYHCTSVDDLESVLTSDDFNRADRIQVCYTIFFQYFLAALLTLRQVCEVVTGKLDYPWRLNAQLKIARAKIARE